MGRFSGKCAIVTGGARGQGAEHVRRLVQDGARVIISDILDAEGRALAAALGGAAQFVRHDVAEAADWRQAIAAAQVLAGGLDYLVNNAGVARMRSIADTDTETFAFHQRVNELGVFLGMKHAAPEITARGGGAIVNVSSLGGLRAGGGDIAYVSSKWAVRGMTKSAARELGGLHIRVNSIHPGVVLTPMLDDIDPSVIEQRIARVPLGRAATLEDISNLVLFLLSEEAAYITGAEIVIDGGLGI